MQGAYCQDSGMRATRFIYVENDPTLRSLLVREFRQVSRVELTFATASPQEALASEELLKADAALLDLALGAGEPNGIEVGLAMRERNPNIGIVVYSQYSLRNMVRRVPKNQSMGWSFIPKSVELEAEGLSNVIIATAKGMSHDLAGTDENIAGPEVLEKFTSRQRAVMALAASGLTGVEISKRLNISHDAVRKDLSRVYELLVPSSEGGDLRTKAVLNYMQIMREPSWE